MGSHWRLLRAVTLEMNNTRKLQEKKTNSEALDLCFKIRNFVPRDDYGNSALCSADPEFQVRCFGV